MIDVNLILFDSNATDKEGVFEQLATMVCENGYAQDSSLVKQALKIRESESSTGMMDGFAIPHAKNAVITKPCVAIIKLLKGIEWKSMDDKPITSVIALFIPDSEVGTTHLQYLSKIARLLMNDEFKSQFNAASTPEGVQAIVNRFLEA